MTPNEYQKEALRTASGMSQEYPRILNGLMGLNVLYAKKNHDYGDSFHAQHEQEIAEQKTCDEGASNAD